MDELSERISTTEILRAMFIALFEQTAVSVKMWRGRGNIDPCVQAISRKLAWWRGECGHVYQMAVRDRVRAKPGYCPYCSGRKRPERPIRLD